MNFIQKSTFTVASKFIGAILSLGTSIIIARLLNVAQVGQYQIMITSQVLVITILAMGFGNATIFFANRQNIDKTLIISNTFKVYALVSALYAIVSFFAIRYASSYFGSYHILPLLFFSVGSGFLLLYNILLPVLYIDLQVVKVQILSVMASVILLSGLILSFFLRHANLNLTLLLVGISNVIPSVALLYIIRKNIRFSIPLDFGLLRQIFYYGIKIAATNLVFILSSNVVIYLLRALKEDSFYLIGLYSRATAVANMFMLVPMSLGPLLYSKWASVSQERISGQVERTIRVFVVYSVLCFVFVFIWGDTILRVLYGKEYVGAQGALTILSFGVLFTSINQMLVNLFSGIGKPLITLYGFLVSLLLTIISAALLIPTYDIGGAAMAVLLGIVFNALFLLYFAHKEIGLSIPLALLVRRSDFQHINRLLFRK